jgi:hypothetical protein
MQRGRKPRIRHVQRRSKSAALGQLAKAVAMMAVLASVVEEPVRSALEVGPMTNVVLRIPVVRFAERLGF